MIIKVKILVFCENFEYRDFHVISRRRSRNFDTVRTRLETKVMASYGSSCWLAVKALG